MASTQTTTEPMGILIAISDDFKKIIAGYNQDPRWKYIITQLRENKALGDNAALLPFEIDADGLVYRVTHGVTTLRQLCVPENCLKNIFDMARPPRIRQDCLDRLRILHPERV